jgi:hypothetical protein
MKYRAQDKIEVEPEEPEQATGDLAMSPNERNVVALPQLLRVRRFVPDEAEARHAAAFLVDRDDRLDVAEVAEVVDQLPELCGTRDIAPEEDVAAGLHATEQRSRLRIELGAGDAGEQKLTELADFIANLESRLDQSSSCLRFGATLRASGLVHRSPCRCRHG